MIGCERIHQSSSGGWTIRVSKYPIDHPIVTTVGAAFTEIKGSEPIYRGMPYGADMRLLVNNGNTSTLMFGPGNVRKAHQPDELYRLRIWRWSSAHWR